MFPSPLNKFSRADS
ncbi:hypothetical protein BLA29_015412 [Euroglyphus maynei]|uniref:Uncharacterized protein n=1 Tax=Euroglyphus maynei TaxID=6958 RepID=A0A1Y3AYC6_EURMA|nr:hypothetical protein BLA29_015412 [Euroglyphus maynei]